MSLTLDPWIYRQFANVINTWYNTSGRDNSNREGSPARALQHAVKGGNTMRKTVLAVLTATILMAGAAVILAAEKSATAPQSACPVTGKPVDKSIHIDFQGQRIYFCSAACPADFRKDPEKYFAKLAADGVELENIQTACPVSGEKLGEDSDMGGPVTVSYKGRTVTLCCTMCKPKFEKDPAKYLAKLPGEQPAPAK